MKVKILSIGGMCLDINCQNFPHNNKLISETETVGEEYEVVPGGSAIVLQRLVLNTFLVLDMAMMILFI